MLFLPTPGGGTTVSMRFAADPVAHARKQEAAE
jgi:two-component system nitrogen regulation sensor histidine kinase NtrY